VSTFCHICFSLIFKNKKEEGRKERRKKKEKKEGREGGTNMID
jgi:hypothetical protein